MASFITFASDDHSSNILFICVFQTPCFAGCQLVEMTVGNYVRHWYHHPCLSAVGHNSVVSLGLSEFCLSYNCFKRDFVALKVEIISVENVVIDDMMWRISISVFVWCGNTCMTKYPKWRMIANVDDITFTFVQFRITTLSFRDNWRSGVRSAMRAASQLPGKGAHWCGYCPCTCTLTKKNLIMMMMINFENWIYFLVISTDKFTKAMKNGQIMYP